MKRYRFLLVFVLALVLALAVEWQYGMPGSNGDGIWRGTFDINGRGDFDFVALYVNGNVIALSNGARVAYRGNMKVEGTNYFSDMDMFFINGSPFEKVSLSGTFDSPRTITAQFITEKVGDKGTLVLNYDKEAYEKESSLDKLAGKWILYEGIVSLWSMPIRALDKLAGKWILYEGVTITKFSITDDGRIRGADTTGCSYEGIIKPIDSTRNAYQSEMLASSCDQVDGKLSGMGFLVSSIEEDDTLHLQVSNDDWGLYLPNVRDQKAKQAPDKPA